MAVKEFMHGERPTPLTDQEALQRSRDVLMAYSRCERLHPFADQHIARARRTIQAATGTFDMQIGVGILNRFDDMVQSQRQIDSTGRAMTDMDRINSYDAIQNQVDFEAVQEEARNGPPQPPRRGTPVDSPLLRRTRTTSPQQETQRSTPRGFNSFVRRYNEERPRPAGEAADAILIADAQHYLNFLTRSPEHLDRFAELFASTRAEDMDNFDFFPVPSPGNLVFTFRQWLSNQRELLAAIQTPNFQSLDAWVEALHRYGTYLQTGLAPLPEHSVAFIAVRQQIADSERRLYDEFRPSRDMRSREIAPSGSVPDDIVPPVVVLSFRDWVRRAFADPTTRRGNVPSTALDQDLNGYDLYLRQQVAVLQLNEFRSLRSSVTNSAFEFTPAIAGVPSLLTWLAETNESRQRRGLGELSGTEALEGYASNVVQHPRYGVPKEVLQDWQVAETYYAEENRRQMYGYPRGSYSPLVERLREARNTFRDLVYSSFEYWILTGPNPVVYETRTIRPFLRRHIATEEDPSAKEWRRLREHLLQAQRLLLEESNRQQEEGINERLRNPVPRTPQTVDEDTSTVNNSPPRQRHIRGPP
ncbi:hypothetical protein L207DRAFT_530745 [Hyaloscypha variabilis F]|uniref:Uncharacterized protein n=1 Tax=Hyaloscypha variabilis (strain UAMH 11265 / GT02V1 / F) TaxID=1149755 RepID=A0A2J6RLC5_HYAVF|nr:hypothetical protein L207DRAFT_530745 [Hyaloscypha variabilis F]